MIQFFSCNLGSFYEFLLLSAPLSLYKLLTLFLMCYFPIFHVNNNIFSLMVLLIVFWNNSLYMHLFFFSWNMRLAMILCQILFYAFLLKTVFVYFPTPSMFQYQCLPCLQHRKNRERVCPKWKLAALWIMKDASVALPHC